MAGQDRLEHPYSAVDLSQLDRRFLSLLAYSAEQSCGSQGAVGIGLRLREKLLFRFGVFVGEGEWGLAREIVGSLMGDGLLSEPEVERAAAEAVMIRGWAARAHLGPALEATGLRGPASVAQAVEQVQANSRTPTLREDTGGCLTERELFALGLGVTWGARCWDT